MELICQMRRTKRAFLFTLVLCLTLGATPLRGLAAYETLRPWDIGSAVRAMQQALKDLGYGVKVDGTYGPVSEAAVRSFQRKNGLQVDGIAGDSTLSLLFSQAQAPAADGTTSVYPASEGSVTQQPQAAPDLTLKLRSGSTGSEVALLQSRLAQLGYQPGRTDGVFDRGTADAVLSFQSRNGLKTDGIAGPLTLSRLHGSAASAAAQGEEQPSAGTPVGTAVVSTPNGGSLRIRSSAASQTGNVLASIPNKSVVQVLSSGGGWTRCVWNGRTGYVMSQYLQEQGATAPAPSEGQQPAFSRILRPGDKGQDVLYLQQRLQALSYALSLSSSYDSDTVAAVRAFQTASGLKADGVFGPVSLGALSSASPAGQSGGASGQPSGTAAYATLRMGDRDGADQAVSRMQKRLSELGYTLSADGSFGAKTHDALVSFQQQNGLTPSGVADAATQSALYSAEARKNSGGAAGIDLSAGRIGGPSSGSVKLLRWYDEVKPALGGGPAVRVYHPASGVSFNLKIYSLGRHADAEPKTLKDTQLMNGAFGAASWNTRPVYVQLPSGVWTLGTMHNYPHLSGSIADNGFGGHLCVHFLRDLEETKKLDPNYGMQNQLAIRKAWKGMTGEEVN